jgi:hypothetical protein
MDDLDQLAAVARQHAVWGPSINYAYPPCTVCGFRGPPMKVAKGSALIAVVLLLIAIVPGLLYMIFFSGHKYVCAKCGAKRADA